MSEEPKFHHVHVPKVENPFFEHAIDAFWPVICPACEGDGKCFTILHDGEIVRRSNVMTIKQDGEVVCARCDGKGTIVE